MAFASRDLPSYKSSFYLQRFNLVLHIAYSCLEKTMLNVWVMHLEASTYKM